MFEMSLISFVSTVMKRGEGCLFSCDISKNNFIKKRKFHIHSKYSDKVMEEN
jgi:hypothetical protein